jgi:hypothetical protein
MLSESVFLGVLAVIVLILVALAIRPLLELRRLDKLDRETWAKIHDLNRRKR